MTQSKPQANVRLLRVGESVRHAVADILAREEFRDPDLRGVSVTVSEVRVSADLRNATVFVLPLAGAEADKVLAALNRVGGFIRHRLGNEIRLKYLPHLTFELDESFSEAERIRRLLDSDKVRQDLDDGNGAD